ncbi:MAG: site-2 protease family protein [Blastocatellia bacterium]|nr:site-2 protease family protein [Blastocatellia bacterium]
MRVALRLGSIFGITILVHFSWLLIFALVTFSLVAKFAGQFPQLPQAAHISIGVAASLLFFGSVLFHELAHSWLALRYGYAVRSITLFVFGGVAEIKEEAKQPAAEIWIALIGPLSSYLLALIFGAIWYVTQTSSAVISSMVGWLALVNVGLATFNLLPGLPLDGGRVLRGIVWKVTGNRERATQVAASAGRLFGYFFILQGLFLVFASQNLANGLWLMFIGWFLSNAAEGARVQMETQRAMTGVQARQVMTTDCPVVAAGTSLLEFVESHLLLSGRRCFIVGSFEQPRGLVTLTDVRKVPRHDWANTSVQAVMQPLANLHAVAPTASIEEVLRLMEQYDVAQIAVVEDERVLGLIGREQLLYLIRNRLELAA